MVRERKIILQPSYLSLGQSGVSKVSYYVRFFFFRWPSTFGSTKKILIFSDLVQKLQTRKYQLLVVPKHLT